MASIKVTRKKPLWVDDLLKENDMSCEALVEKCNLSKHVISRILIRQWTPTKHQMQRVAEIFGRKIEEVKFGHNYFQHEERGCS